MTGWSVVALVVLVFSAGVAVGVPLGRGDIDRRSFWKGYFLGRIDGDRGRVVDVEPVKEPAVLDVSSVSSN